MDKAHLCAHMVKHFAGSGRRLRRDDAREFLEELRRVCERELLEVGQFTVPGLAKLLVQKRRARKGRNPVTGQPLVIPPRQVVGARISGKIRKAIERPIERARSENGGNSGSALQKGSPECASSPR